MRLCPQKKSNKEITTEVNPGKKGSEQYCCVSLTELEFPEKQTWNNSKTKTVQPTEIKHIPDRGGGGGNLGPEHLAQAELTKEARTRQARSSAPARHNVLELIKGRKDTQGSSSAPFQRGNKLILVTEG